MAPVVWFSMLAALILPPVYMAYSYHETGDYTGALVWAFPLLLALTLRRSRECSLRIAKGLRQEGGESVVATSLNRNAAFILYLREFDLERKHLDNFGHLGLMGAARTPLDVEAQIVEMFDHRIPIVGLTDPQNPTPLPGVHRFSEVPLSWEPIVNELIKSAYLIIVSLDKISEGVRYELEQINKFGRDEHTIIIAGKRRVVRSIKRTWPKKKILLSQSIWIKQRLKNCISRTGREVGFSNKNGCLHKLWRLYCWPLALAGIILIIALTEANVGILELIVLFLGVFFSVIVVRWYLKTLVAAGRYGWRIGSGINRTKNEMPQQAAETPKLDALMALLLAHNK